MSPVNMCYHDVHRQKNQRTYNSKMKRRLIIDSIYLLLSFSSSIKDGNLNRGQRMNASKDSISCLMLLLSKGSSLR